MSALRWSPFVALVALMASAPFVVDGLELSLEREDFLWALAALPVVWLGCRFTLTDQSLPQLALSAALRTCALAFLTMALVNPMHRSEHPAETTTVFVVDVSASMAPEALKRAEGVIQRAWERRGEGEVKVVTASTTPRVLDLESAERVTLESAQGPEALHTDLEAAFLTALGLLSEERVAHVVLVTDGRETRGDLANVTSMALEHQVVVHHLDLTDVPTPTELMVTDLELPSEDGAPEARVPFSVAVVAQVMGTADVVCSLLVDGEQRATGSRPGVSGEVRIPMELRIEEGGDHRLEARCRAEGPDQDQSETNNRLERNLHIPAPSRILVVEGERRHRRDLVQALEDDFDVEVRGPRGVPSSAQDARDFDLVLLSDVPRYGSRGRENLGPGQVAALETYVRGGGALVVTGGENSYGPGGFTGTPFANKLLPLQLEVDQEEEIPSLALMLVIDRSGSMSGPKITLAKEAARATLSVLQSSDMLGVVAFDSAPHVLVRLQRASNRMRITDRLSRLKPGGGTSIYPALQAAYDALDGVEARRKHIILLTDGVSSSRAQVVDLVTQRVREQVTVSSVAVGVGSDQALLMQVAEMGGGRYYFTDRADNIPQLFLKEAHEVSRQALVEDRFRPRIVKRHRGLQMFGGIGWSKAPPLLGYTSTRPRRGAQVLMTSHQGEPLLAQWRLGLGRVVAWTSDVKNKWSHYWLRWPGYAQFWRQLIRDSRRVASSDPALQVQLEARRGEILVAVDAVDPEDGFIGDLQSEALITDPLGETQRVALRETAPGHYEGAVPARHYGPYTLEGTHRASAEEGDQVYRSRGDVVWPYPEELLTGESDLSVVEELTRVTSGRKDPSLSELTDSRGRTIPHQTATWPLGVYVALGLVLLDVLLRRLRLGGSRTLRWEDLQG